MNEFDRVLIVQELSAHGIVTVPLYAALLSVIYIRAMKLSAAVSKTRTGE